MKIMKVIDKKVRGKVYYKYRINLPVKLVEGLGFSGKDIEIISYKDRLVIRKKKDI